MLLRLTGSREHLEDLAQDVFLRLFRALPGFREQALLSTYLYRITVNVAQDEWKRRRREDQPLVSISDEVSDWEDRLAHPDRNAEEQIADHEFQHAVDRGICFYSATLSVPCSFSIIRKNARTSRYPCRSGCRSEPFGRTFIAAAKSFATRCSPQAHQRGGHLAGSKLQLRSPNTR